MNLEQLKKQQAAFKRIVDNPDTKDSVRATAQKKLDEVNAKIKEAEGGKKEKEKPAEKKEQKKAEKKDKKKPEKKKPAEKKEKKKEEPKVSIGKKDKDFTISEKDGATLVGIKGHDWVVTIEKKGDKFVSSCCSDDYKHDDQPTKEKAIAQAKEFLYCKKLFSQAKKRAEDRKKNSARAEKLKTDVSATLEKTEETIENKVEEKQKKGESFSEEEVKEMKSQVTNIVELIATDIKTKEKRIKWIKGLISELQKALKDME